MTDKEIPFTEFDAAVSPKELNIIKASLPYINVNGRKLLSIYVKFKELSNTFSLLNDNNPLSICERPVAEKASMNELFDNIKVYLDKNEIDMVNNCVNTINTINMYNEYMNVFNKIDEA